MKIKIAVLLMALACSGCASFSTTQKDERGTDSYGNEKTTITTKVKSRTFWDSQAALANFRASQTEKTQGASVGSLNQSSSGTNTVQLLNAAGDFLKAVGGAAK